MRSDGARARVEKASHRRNDRVIRMAKYSPLDPRVFNIGPVSTWINLGRWTGDHNDYQTACEYMAQSVGDMVGPSFTGLHVLDVGCGCGDSLVLWKEKFGAKTVVGVNVTKSECVLAQKRISDLGYQESVHVVHQDALSFICKTFPPSVSVNETCFDVVLSVDALYHVDTRLDFLSNVGRVLSRQGARCFLAIDTFGTYDFSNSATKASYKQAFWKSPLRFICLFGISAASGIPLANLLYRGDSLRHLLDHQAMLTQCQDVTDQVFRPFSIHMFGRALSSQHTPLLNRVQLVAASLFMRLIAASGLVQVCLYRIDFDFEDTTE